MNGQRQIGGYLVLRLLGKGGMSEVYEVENPRLGSRHALKLFTYEKNDDEVRERFLIEGRLLAKLNHPRVVKVTDFGVDEPSGQPYFVMDLVLTVNGEVKSLGEVPPGTADEEEIGRWYDDLREGLAYIHGNGVIHRDLKLQNVLLGPDGHALLTDFGISKIFDPDGEGNTIVDTVNTIVKMKEGRSLVMGSVGYMAPELEMGVAASPRSDYYALGVIVYRLLTGTWCDSRTDIVSTLETYNPVWKDILPKLLHSNPNGRECVPYAEEIRRLSERREYELEERLLAATARGRVSRRLSRVLAIVGAGLLSAVSVLSLQCWKASNRGVGDGALLVAQATACDFDEIFRIPADVKAEEQTDEHGEMIVPAREDLAMSRIDMLVITHDLFARLRAGAITVDRVVAELERLQDEFDESTDSVFERWPNGYVQAGNDQATHWLLGLALERLNALAER